MAASSNNLVSFLVSEQVPDYVRDDHPNFVNFVKAYYEFLEQTTGPIYRTKNLNYYNDIDETLDEFIEYFRREYAESIPTDILGDKRLTTKFIKDLYRRKGSREAYKFLFRELYGEEIELDFPGEDVIKASDSVWQQDIKVRVIETDAVRASPQFTEGTIILGTDSSANATISGSVTKVISGQRLLELDLTSLNGQFNSNDTIKFVDSPATFAIANVIGTITVNDGGSFYTVNDTATAQIGDKIGKLTVTAVDDTNSNAIQTMVVSDFGAGFSGVPTVTFDDGNNSANVTVNITGTAIFPGQYTDTRSLISESSTKLFDGVRFQYYSYVVRVGLAVETYRNIVKELIHPSGMEIFGEVTIRTLLNGRVYRSEGNELPAFPTVFRVTELEIDESANTIASVADSALEKELLIINQISANSQVIDTEVLNLVITTELQGRLYESNNYSLVLGEANRNKVLEPEIQSTAFFIRPWAQDQVNLFADRQISLFPGFTKSVARPSEIDIESTTP